MTKAHPLAPSLALALLAGPASAAPPSSFMSVALASTSALLAGHASDHLIVLKLRGYSAPNGLGSFKSATPLAQHESGDTYLIELDRSRPRTLDESLDLLRDLQADPAVEYAYFNPIASDATWDAPADALPIADGRAPTPDLESRQRQLEAAPRGVGARDAWATGADGRGIRVIDVETCYETEHEDFARAFYVGGNPRECGSTHHGTAVWGEIAAKRDARGVSGIAHGVQYGVHGFVEGDLSAVTDAYTLGITTAINGAAAQLEAGDVLVIEQQMHGPDNNSAVAVEYWPHIFAALKAATDRGVLCIEAAGNGGSNLDHSIYGGAFDLAARDSGCILVGAGDMDLHERLDFSNFGSRVDARGFGRGVVSTGYGDVFNGGTTRQYTARFNGTSSATPIVAGAVAVVSGIARARGRVLTPLELRAALRATGTPQGSASAGERIGNLPDIAALVRQLGLN